MKRLHAVDLLRGLAIVSVVFFHAMIFHSDADGAEAAAASPRLMAFILYLVTWAGGFGMLSGLAWSVSLYGRFKAGRLPARDLLRQASLTTAAILGINYLYLAVFSPGFLTPGATSIGLLPAFLRTGEIVWCGGERLLFATALTMVAWGTFFTGLCLRLLVPNGGAERRVRNYVVIGLVATAFLWTYPLVQDLVRPWMASPVTWPSLPGAVLASWLAGPMDPIFPYAGFSLFGALLGMMLVDGVSRSRVLLVGYGTGACYGAVGWVTWRVWGFWNNPWDTPSLVPLLAIVGPMILVLTACLHLMDLSGDRARAWWGRHTRGLRLFGMLSLTCFVLEGPVAAGLRRIVELVRPGFTTDSAFVFLVFAPLVTALWAVALRVWARWDFVGSFEWMLVEGMARWTGRRSRRLEAGRILDGGDEA